MSNDLKMTQKRYIINTAYKCCCFYIKQDFEFNF